MTEDGKDTPQIPSSVQEFEGLQGKEYAVLSPILSVEKINKSPLALSLDDILGKDIEELFRAIKALPGRVSEFYGTTSIVNLSDYQLPYDSNPTLEEKTRKARGRNVGVNMLIKTARGGECEGVISYNEALKRDSYASRLPGIAPFSVLVSEPRLLETGQLAMATEFSIQGHSIDDPKLSKEGRQRILYQLLSIGQSFHNAGLAGVDYGKTHIFYLTSDAFKGNASPDRVKLFDFGYWNELPTDKNEKAAMIQKDLRIEADTLNYFYLPLIPQDEQIPVRELLDKMGNRQFESFEEAAKSIDSDGKFRAELEEINRQCQMA